MCPEQVLFKGEVLSPHPNLPTVHIPAPGDALMKSQAEQGGSITISIAQTPSHCLSPNCPNQAAVLPPASLGHERERETSKTRTIYLATWASFGQEMDGFALLVSFR